MECDENWNELTRSKIKNSILKLVYETKTNMLKITEYERKKEQNRRQQKSNLIGYQQ